ncbi:hypothetical protein HPULCUR_004245 [Helicostylum pulchrum]|uniref:Uncharacterized protein n=1 Tax=Helicostylum pulchrum TaxID=562976 RepID=A0ABP9XVL8_9FUNG
MSKYHVTIEDCIDQDELQHNTGYDEIDLNRVSSNQSSNSEESTSSRRQAWEHIDALEEQARSEKMQNQSTARENATKTARIVREAQQSSGY